MDTDKFLFSPKKCCINNCDTAFFCVDHFSFFLREDVLYNHLLFFDGDGKAYIMGTGDVWDNGACQKLSSEYMQPEMAWTVRTGRILTGLR